MRVLIFDYDGTIVDSMDCVIKGFNHAAKIFGLKVRNKKQVTDLYLDNVFYSLMKTGIKKDNLNQFMIRMREGYKINSIKPFSGMRAVLKLLKKENKIFIITSNFKKTIQKSLNKNGIKVDGILGKEQGTSKVKKISLIKKRYPKSEIFYIGDTAGDIKEAHEAGVRDIAVSWGFHDAKTLLKFNPDFIVSKPTDL